jgi:hypothetical protein
MLLTIIPDFVTGDGSKKRSQYDLKSEGLAGAALHAATELTGEAALLPGATLGMVVGAIIAPFSRHPKMTIKSYTDTGMELFRAGVISGVGAAAGLALAAARLPSLIVKGVAAGLGGLAGSLYGLAKSVAILVRK